MIGKNIKTTGNTAIIKWYVYVIAGSKQEGMPLKIFGLRDLKKVHKKDKNCLK